MLKVPIFGMEANPESLAGRRRGYCIAYGYPLDDWENVTEVIYHIEHIPSTSEGQLMALATAAAATAVDESSLVLEVELYSSVTPYSRAWVRYPFVGIVPRLVELEKGNLWKVARMRPIRTRLTTPRKGGKLGSTRPPQVGREERKQ